MKAKSYKELMQEYDSLNEEFTSSEQFELITEDEQFLIDNAITKFEELYLNEGKNIRDLENDIINEGLLGSIFGGLTGFALGKSVGKVVANALGVKSGVLYDMLTSRLVSAALGVALGKKI